MELAIIRIPSADLELIRVVGEFAYPWHCHARRWVLGTVVSGGCTLTTSESARHPAWFTLPPLTGHALTIGLGSTVITASIGPEALHPAGTDTMMKAIRDAATQAGWSTTWVRSLEPAFGEVVAAAEPVRPRVVAELLDEVADVGTGSTVPRLAARLGLSSGYLSRTCAARTGLPPHQLLMQRRLRQAQAYLADGMTPADAAHLAGFYDQSHLNREFRRAIGVTPKSYQTAVGTM